MWHLSLSVIQFVSFFYQFAGNSITFVEPKYDNLIFHQYRYMMQTSVYHDLIFNIMEVYFLFSWYINVIGPALRFDWYPSI